MCINTEDKFKLYNRHVKNQHLETPLTRYRHETPPVSKYHGTNLFTQLRYNFMPFCCSVHTMPLQLQVFKLLLIELFAVTCVLISMPTLLRRKNKNIRRIGSETLLGPMRKCFGRVQNRRHRLFFFFPLFLFVPSCNKNIKNRRFFV